MDNLLFFDIEVFAEDALVVFMDINKNVQHIFHNDFVGLEDFIKGKTLVSFNGYFYDDHILHFMLDLKTPKQIKQLNDRIISGEKLRIKNYKFDSLDCFQQINPSFPSLKRIEGNLGRMILESSVPFDIDRKLTPEELEETIKYCAYDVETTVDIYKMREGNYFQPKASLVEMLGKGERWGTTTISANLLLDKPLTKWSNIRVPEEILEIAPPDVAEMWLTKEKGTIKTIEFDNEITWGFGGLHSQNIKKKYFENVHLLDVASLYPSIICNYNILGSATEKYKGILEERIRIKHTEPERQAGLKLVLNSVYGLLKSQYSLLHNPKASTTVCAIGQCLLYDLATRLSPTCEIVQLNTDGVAFTTETDHYKKVWKDWESDHNLSLEEDLFTKLWQLNVNNYIGMTPDGKLKVKGSDVARYYKDVPFQNNSARIIDLCVVNKLVYNKDVLDTLLDNLEKPYLFQYILQAGSTYAGTVDQDGNFYQKVNRVFAAKKPGLSLYKKRHDGGFVKFPDLSEKLYLWNDECSEIKDFEKIVDLNQYYQIAIRRLEAWQ